MEGHVLFVFYLSIQFPNKVLIDLYHWHSIDVISCCVIKSDTNKIGKALCLLESDRLN